ncbi:hypothetical protein LTR56_004569 [Elasticomyces elasticus]|nr:hypothetical protein LTR56_004569 [Elasticomyces elasticus]KAK3659911.1 hypothetical protein LTR22_008278 [Elasticomyces elasticus]KAK4925908.1 hypothetical protein LTR49_007046 [Elasticomyces elasticus]KAK5768145.1 hypothetical protein LTS12_001629 [Elasticomyces elasticus]
MAKRTGEDDGVVQKKKRKTPQRKVKSITTSTGKCMLPTIAPELRNKIYELVLLENKKICINKKLRMPALLQVCRQIRSDTLVMWYERNAFSITVMHCHADVLLRWVRHIEIAPLRGINKVPTLVFIRGTPDWSNLMAWSKAVWVDGGVTFDDLPGKRKLIQVINAATAMADRLGGNGRPWSECESALEDFRVAVGAYDSKWLR